MSEEYKIPEEITFSDLAIDGPNFIKIFGTQHERLFMTYRRIMVRELNEWLKQMSRAGIVSIVDNGGSFTINLENGYSSTINIPGGSGGGGGLLDTTYSDLVTTISSNELVPGTFYRITDFNTRHYILDGQVTDSSGDTITGTVESLIVLATSENTISTEAYSEQFPTDMIRYDWNPANWLTDTGFSVGGTIISGFKGVITYRHDTINNVSAHYDWRNVKFRRWG